MKYVKELKDFLEYKPNVIILFCGLFGIILMGIILDRLPVMVTFNISGIGILICSGLLVYFGWQRS